VPARSSSTVSLRRGPKPPPPAAVDVPDKLFFKIGEVARLTGLQPYVLRYWETEFPHIRPRKGKGGQRVYRREDVLAIIEVQRMLHAEGYTIAGARRKLRQTRRSPQARAAGAEGGKEPEEAVEKAREGLREVLDMMENTDSRRAGSRSDPGRGAVR
jgi:DNA-binding transcriptional MerR regulator